MSTSDGSTPLVKLESGGKASILSYNVPEPTSYPGRAFIELDVPQDWFVEPAGIPYSRFLRERTKPKPREEFRSRPAEPRPPVHGSPDRSRGDARPSTRPSPRPSTGKPIPRAPNRNDPKPDGGEEVKAPRAASTIAAANSRERAIVEEDLSEAFRRGNAGPVALERGLDPSVGRALASLGIVGETEVPTNDARTAVVGAPEGTELTAADLALLHPTVIAERGLDSKRPERPIISRTMGGDLRISYVPTPPKVKQRLMLVERYRLSSYLGSYGAGRTLKTFSLLPGERTKLSVKTFRQTEQKRKEASSILDSYTSSSANEFEETIGAEQTNKETYDESLGWHVEAEVSANWGFGSASVSGGAEGSTNSAREELAKNISNTTSKHAAEASSKRDLEVETSYEATETESEENVIEREIENINVGRTLNFVFRQMNQEFITLLHLEDVRVAYAASGLVDEDTGRAVYREVPLSELDSVLAGVLAEEHREEATQIIVDELSSILNYAGEVRSMVERTEVSRSDGTVFRAYVHVRKDEPDVYRDVIGSEIAVPGVILSANKHVMRTDGVVVEALLGQGHGLDDYSTGLQTEAVRSKEIENDAREAETERIRLGIDLVKNGDETAIDRYERIFGPLSNATDAEAKPKAEESASERPADESE